MKLQFKVTVQIERLDKDCQTLKEFVKDDGRAMSGYIKENIINAVRAGRWQYNAVITSSKVTKA